MKLKAQKFTHDHVALSFEAENQAELYQMAALLESLKNASADAVEWKDMEGSHGWTVRVCCVLPNNAMSHERSELAP